ncbi:MAG: hypothetical protein HYX39_04865 [Bacteroidetes bacterium]|nr:hypothetical protein [Bacteroidota bacterium]
MKRNAIYLNATKCIADDILSSGNTYLVLGYFHGFNNFRIDLGGGPIVYHKSNGDILGINVEEMKGVYMAFEIDQIF